MIGPLIGYEVLVAFFLEATFLGIMLFGWKRVSPWLHTLSAIAVAAGTLMSAFFILSANSWMQTPAGYVMRDGIAYPTDWLAVIFNPSFPYRLAHMVAAAYLTNVLRGACGGSAIQHIRVENGAFAGGAFDWATVRHAVRPGTAGGIWVAWGHLADPEDRRSRRRARAGRPGFFSSRCLVAWGW